MVGDSRNWEQVTDVVDDLILLKGLLKEAELPMMENWPCVVH